MKRRKALICPSVRDVLGRFHATLSIPARCIEHPRRDNPPRKYGAVFTRYGALGFDKGHRIVTRFSHILPATSGEIDILGSALVRRINAHGHRRLSTRPDMLWIGNITRPQERSNRTPNALPARRGRFPPQNPVSTRYFSPESCRCCRRYQLICPLSVA